MEWAELYFRDGKPSKSHAALDPQERHVLAHVQRML
jgi:hypothetical protein